MTVIEGMIGKTFTTVSVVGEEELVFEEKLPDGGSCGYKFWHEQSCCEYVYIDDIVGSLDDLVGTPILVAEERVSEDPPLGFDIAMIDESSVWTFYEFRTVKGSVTVRFFGTSNGWYSVDVSVTSWWKRR